MPIFIEPPKKDELLYKLEVNIKLYLKWRDRHLPNPNIAILENKYSAHETIPYYALTYGANLRHDLYTQAKPKGWLINIKSCNNHDESNTSCYYALASFDNNKWIIDSIDAKKWLTDGIADGVTWLNRHSDSEDYVEVFYSSLFNFLSFILSSKKELHLVTGTHETITNKITTFRWITQEQLSKSLLDIYGLQHAEGGLNNAHFKDF